MLKQVGQRTKKLAKGASRRVLPAQWRVHLDLRQEQRMLDGSFRAPDSGTPSIVFFTVHKCASTFTRRAFSHIAEQKLRLRPINLARYFWQLEDGDVYEHIQAQADQAFYPRGFFYGPLRQPLEIPSFEQYRTVLMLRDPRDVLTSFYYSITISHGVPGAPKAREQFLDLRRRWEDSMVDEFVLAWLPEFKRRYEGYLAIKSETGCRLLRYEDMIDDFDRWAADLGSAFGVELTAEDVQLLREMGGFEQNVTESASRHIRQRTPGDHRRKLAPGTVKQITSELRPVLEGFRYSEEGELDRRESG